MSHCIESRNLCSQHFILCRTYFKMLPTALLSNHTSWEPSKATGIRPRCLRWFRRACVSDKKKSVYILAIHSFSYPFSPKWQLCGNRINGKCCKFKNRSILFSMCSVEKDFLLLAFLAKIHGKRNTCADKKILRLLSWSTTRPKWNFFILVFDDKINNERDQFSLE